MRRELTLVAAFVLGCAVPARVAKGTALPVRESSLAPVREPRADAIMSVILGAKRPLGDCVAEERAATSASGKIVLVFDILPSGEVTNVGVLYPETAALELSHCLARVMSGLRFPSSGSGETLTFPFKY